MRYDAGTQSFKNRVDSNEKTRVDLIKRLEDEIEKLQALYIAHLGQKDQWILLLLSEQRKNGGNVYDKNNLDMRTNITSVRDHTENIHSEKVIITNNIIRETNTVLRDSSSRQNQLEMEIRLIREKYGNDFDLYMVEHNRLNGNARSMHDIEIQALRDQLQLSRSQIRLLDDHVNVLKRLIEQLSRGNFGKRTEVVNLINNVEVSNGMRKGQAGDNLSPQQVANHPQQGVDEDSPEYARYLSAPAGVGMTPSEKELQDKLTKAESQILLLRENITYLLDGGAASRNNGDTVNRNMRANIFMNNNQGGNQGEVKLWNLTLEAKYAQAADMIVSLQLDLARCQKRMEEYTLEVKKVREQRDNAVKLLEKNRRREAFYQAEIERLKAFILKLQSEERTYSVTKTVEHVESVKSQEVEEFHSENAQASAAGGGSAASSGGGSGQASAGGQAAADGQAEYGMSSAEYQDEERKRVKRKLSKSERKKVREEKSPFNKGLQYLHIRPSKKKQDDDRKEPPVQSIPYDYDQDAEGSQL